MRPIISLVGSTAAAVQVGTSWTDPGVSAQDVGGDALTEVTTGTVDTYILGISTLTYTAVSAQGDIAAVVQRFIVATGTTSPVLTRVGGNITLTVGDTWSGEPGYSATDNLDGDLTSQVQISGWDGDTTAAGQFTRTYTVTGSQSNVASALRAVTIAVPLPTPDHFIAGPITTAATYNNMAPQGRASVSITVWMLGPAPSYSVLFTAWGATHASQQDGFLVYGYGYGPFFNATNKHWGAGLGSGTVEAGPIMYVFEVDVSGSPSRIRI